MRLKKLLFLCLCLIMVNSISAQEESLKNAESLISKNAIYGSVGTAGVYFSATGYYERMFLGKNEKAKNAFFARAGYGGVASWGGNGSYLLVQGGILTNAKGKSHFEGALGLVFFSEEVYTDSSNTKPSVSAGYRNQKPGKSFIFRAGAGYPEALYVGVGFSFK